ncbi:MAG: DNA-deoxyinosine glycosylase [Oscillospiraceae bacterium]|jgi:TDG/mug DNA glycosylase family protein
MLLKHPFEPVYNGDSRVLILGTFPSVKSRANMFYYGHPQNRFWRVLAMVFGCAEPQSVEEKKEFLLRHGVAIWDVVGSCEIEGSSDSSIRNVSPNDIGAVLAGSSISRIYANGRAAERIYNRYILPVTGKSIVPLPSTSPANAMFSLERLAREWRIIKQNMQY